MHHGEKVDLLKGLQLAGGRIGTRSYTVSCQILLSTRSVNSTHMLNREGRESPCIKEASDVESQQFLILSGMI